MKRKDEGEQQEANNEYKVEGSQRRGWNQQKKEQMQQQKKMANPFSLDTLPQNKAKAADLQMGMEMSMKSNKSRFDK